MGPIPLEAHKYVDGIVKELKNLYDIFSSYAFGHTFYGVNMAHSRIRFGYHLFLNVFSSSN